MKHNRRRNKRTRRRRRRSGRKGIKEVGGAADENGIKEVEEEVVDEGGGQEEGEKGIMEVGEEGEVGQEVREGEEEKGIIEEEPGAGDRWTPHRDLGSRSSCSWDGRGEEAESWKIEQQTP